MKFLCTQKSILKSGMVKTFFCWSALPVQVTFYLWKDKMPSDGFGFRNWCTKKTFQYLTNNFDECAGLIELHKIFLLLICIYSHHVISIRSYSKYIPDFLKLRLILWLFQTGADFLLISEVTFFYYQSPNRGLFLWLFKTEGYLVVVELRGE